MKRIIEVMAAVVALATIFVAGMMFGKHYCMLISGEASIRCVRTLSECSFRYLECLDLLKGYTCSLPAMHGNPTCDDSLPDPDELNVDLSDDDLPLKWMAPKEEK